MKGFAVTLSIGVLTSLFSAILVTRLLIVTWLRRTKPKDDLRIVRPSSMYPPPLIVIRHIPNIDFMRLAQVRLCLLAGADAGARSCCSLNRAQLRHRLRRRHADRGAHDSTARPISPRCAPTSTRLAARRCALQHFGGPTDVLIRLPRQPGGDAAQEQAVDLARRRWARQYRGLPPHRGGRPDGGRPS